MQKYDQIYHFICTLCIVRNPDKCQTTWDVQLLWGAWEKTKDKMNKATEKTLC